MKVEDVMTRTVKPCHPDESLARAAQLMWDNDCGCVPVVDDEKRVVGIVTDRDVCMAALLNGRPLHELLVAQAMAHKPVRVGPHDDLREAQQIMRHARVRRLPVVDVKGHLVGILSLHDLAMSAKKDRRLFAGSRMRDLAETLTQISKPWKKSPEAPRRPGKLGTAFVG
ncbi:MAG: CBS domain-containing protein [Polyangiaceae bacterium]|nr:CBS domain-containing protein [Polyangiaceae bacterium]